MTGKERFLTALRCGEPDAVPLWDLGLNEESIVNIARHFTDKTPPVKLVHEMTPDELLAIMNTLLLVVEELDFDGVTVPALTGREPEGENFIRDKLGVLLMPSSHGEPVVLEGPIKTPDDLKNYKPPRPDASWYLGVHVAKSKIDGRKAIVFQMPGTFKISWALRGKMENLMYDYFDRPEFAHELADVVTNFCVDVFTGAVAAGADAILLDGDMAMNTTTLMSPKQYREFIKPYHARIVDAVHNAGGLIIKHSDGNLWPILDDLLEIGIDGIHPIQPQCMSIAEVKAHLAGRACVLGNIDCQDLLPDGTVEEVEQAVIETIRAASPGGGHILSSSNSIHPGVKPENAIAMFRAGRKYGRYPITA